MSNETVLKDYYGKIIGYIETRPDGNKVIRNFHRQIKGTYDKKQDVTRDFYGRIIARGDCLTMLLND